MRNGTRGGRPHQPTRPHRPARRVRLGEFAVLVALLGMTACVDPDLSPTDFEGGMLDTQTGGDVQTASHPDGTILGDYEWISPGAPSTGNEHALRMTTHGVDPGFQFETDGDLTIDLHWRHHDGVSVAYLWQDPEDAGGTGLRAFGHPFWDDLTFENPFGGEDIAVEGDFFDGEWYHVRMVLDASENTYTVYIDGEEVGQSHYDGEGFTAGGDFRAMGWDGSDGWITLDHDRFVMATEAIHDPDVEVTSAVLHYELEDGQGDMVTNAAGASEPLEILTEGLPEWTLNHPGYEAELEAEGGSPPDSWELVEGDLPRGLDLDEDGTIHGDPKGKDEQEFTVAVTDGGGQTAERSFSITINPPPKITTGSLTPAIEGESYDERIVAQDGTGEYRWQLAEGSLPDWLRLDPDSGRVTQAVGRVQGNGSYEVTVELSDEVGASHEREFMVRVATCRDLVANRQQNGPGEVCVVDDGENLHVTYQSNGGLFEETRLAVSADEPGQGEWTEAHPSTRWQNPAGHPLPERFPHGGEHNPGQETVAYRVPLSQISGGVDSGETLYIAAFAEMNGRQASEAWAEGSRFREPGHWATYFTYSQE